MTDEPSQRGLDVRPTAESHFSWLRTRLSVERTLMSWVRTAIALIGFGFTIVQFFERLAQMHGVHPAAAPHAPRYLGLGLIGSGLFALLVSVGQYRQMVTYLWTSFPSLAGADRTRKHTPVLLVAVSMILVGLFAFVAVLMRLP